MFSASTALAGNVPPSIIIDACVLSGVLGTLSAGGSAALSRLGAYGVAVRFLLLSGVCATASALCLVAGTQRWMATAFICACTAAIGLAILRGAEDKKKILDVEAGM